MRVSFEVGIWEGTEGIVWTEGNIWRFFNNDSLVYLIERRKYKIELYSIHFGAIHFDYINIASLSE